MATRMVGPGIHSHGCTGCHGRYEDVCREPNVNATCSTCRGKGASWAVLIANRLPRDCCKLHSRLATKDELKTYRLSTGCVWFRCSICARTQPYTSPTKEQS